MAKPMTYSLFGVVVTPPNENLWYIPSINDHRKA